MFNREHISSLFDGCSIRVNHLVEVQEDPWWEKDKSLGKALRSGLLLTWSKIKGTGVGVQKKKPNGKFVSR